MASSIIPALAFLLCFAALQLVFALQCDVTDVNSLNASADISKLTVTKKDCKVYYEDLSKLLGTNVTEVEKLTCFSSDVVNQKNVNGTIKGCVGAKGCDGSKDIINKVVAELQKNSKDLQVNVTGCKTNFGTRLATPTTLLFIIGAFLINL